MWFVLDSLLVVAGALVLLFSAYLGLLAVLARRGRFDERESTTISFDIIVPAHNEASGIGSTIVDLQRIDYPPEQRRVIVVADNCSDDTAAVAARHGALVWKRDDTEKRGKGHALAFAFRRSLAEGRADAVVVVDADTVVTPNILKAFARHLGRGAQALQAHYGVRNRDDSWRTVLMTLALSLFHEVRSLGRERLRTSVGLRGNGMCFSVGLIARFPHDATSVVEDIEYGLILGHEGVRVHFVGEASVLGDMPVTSESSRVQRARWEGGRRLLARAWAPRLLSRGLRERNRVMLDLGLDLLLPPLSTLGAWAVGGLISSALVSMANGQLGLHFLLFAASVVCLGIYLFKGLSLSGLGWRGAQVFLWAPVFLVWRITKVSGHRKQATKAWARTPRERGVG